jgi:ACT domain-containing protein
MSTDGEGVIVMSIDREGAIALSTDRAGAVVVAALMKGVEIEINVLTVEKGLQVEAEAEAETMIDLEAGVETVIDLKRIIIAQTMMLILYLKYRPCNWPIGF